VLVHDDEHVSGVYPELSQNLCDFALSDGLKVGFIPVVAIPIQVPGESKGVGIKFWYQSLIVPDFVVKD